MGLKAEKSCFLSRWVIFFFVLLSANGGSQGEREKGRWFLVKFLDAEDLDIDMGD